MSTKIVMAIDPGTRKSGFAVVRSDGKVLEREQLEQELLVQRVKELEQRYQPNFFVMGNGTGSKQLRKILEEESGCLFLLVDEFETTRQARQRYFKEYPPQGWRAWVPLGLLYPPVPIDDWAAVIIAERFLKSLV